MKKVGSLFGNFRYAGKRSRIISKIREGFVTTVLFVLLLGLAFVIIYPFLYKILASFMSSADIYDSTVGVIPKNWSFEHYKSVLDSSNFLKGLFRYTLPYAFVVSLMSVLSSVLVGYGLARFKFPGQRIIFILVVLTLMIPNSTISIGLYSTFRYFDLFGLIKLFTGGSIKLTSTVFPMAILSATCIGFRGGIYVILMRQYFIGVPNELTEAARVDGAGVFRTFFSIMLPMAQSMIVVVATLSFAWQWTDTFYTNILMGEIPMLSNIILELSSVRSNQPNFYSVILLANAAAVMAIVPLVIIYTVLQKKIIAGVESSGLVG